METLFFVIFGIGCDSFRRRIMLANPKPSKPIVRLCCFLPGILFYKRSTDRFRPYELQ